MSLFKSHLKRDDKPIIIFDGGTGTSFQNMNLSASDFGGDKYEGCNENLVLTLPKAVEKVHSICTSSKGSTELIAELSTLYHCIRFPVVSVGVIR